MTTTGAPPGRPRSTEVTAGRDRAPARSMLRAVGFTDDDFERPQVGVASSWNEVTPCNIHLDRLAVAAKDGVRLAGAVPLTFNTITVSDAIAMGHEGMRASLVSREVIADSVELVMHAERLDGLVVPGGESTVIGKLAARYGLLEPLRERAGAGLPVFGTCAGMIFLAREVEGPPQDLLGVLDVRVRRNAFGRQVASFEAEVEVKGIDGDPVSGAFIRAPWVADAGPEVEVLAEVDGKVVAVRQGNLLATAFHPELTGEVRLHRWLVDLVAERGSS